VGGSRAQLPRAGPNPKSEQAQEKSLHSRSCERCLSMSSPEAVEAPPWSAWAKEHGRLIWLRLVAQGIAHDRARELTQEVWEVLYRRWRNGTLVELTMPGLALSQATYLAWSEWRRPGARLIDWESDLEPTTPYDEEQQMAHRLQLSKIAELLRECSPADRRIFELYYSPPGMSSREVSREVGSSHTRVCKVLQRLREKIERLS
jgi:DNA-directed RNA polymerase specialized sigma24 family protein